MNTPFVDVLAQHLLTKHGSEPASLARCLVLVPTRRSVASLRDALLKQSGGQPLLLPQIQPLGEIDVELLMPDVVWSQGANPLPDLPPAMSTRQRVFELARLVETFHAASGEKITADHSVRLAMALGDLIDDLAREEVSYDKLATLVEGELAAHWQQTLAFLHIITDAWPKRLEELARMDAVERRSKVLNRLADYWEHTPPLHPVIAAGSTGSIPATARLLKVISQLANGEVILPGLDLASDEETFQASRRSISHPHYGLYQLLNHIGCPRDEVMTLPSGALQGASATRMEFLSDVFIPAELSHRWRTRDVSAEMLEGITMVECADEREEAQAISLMLRNALEQEGAHAMLVTHDRALARRVAVMLRRYNIAVEDGGGLPLLRTPNAVFAMLLVRATLSQAPADMLALLKHPLCRLGTSALEKFEHICAIELTLFRGIRTGETLQKRVERVASNEAFDAKALLFLRDFTRVLSPLSEAMRRPLVGLADIQALVITVMEQLAEAGTAEDLSSASGLWSGQAGHALVQQLSEIADHGAHLGMIEPHHLVALYSSLLGRETYQPTVRTHPRLTILSPSDARMQHADMIILAGLNEGCWPPAPQSDPWMSRAMRESIGLQPYERQIGQSAHDFLSLCAAPKVVLTRATKGGGTPVLPSRWWQRLMTVLDAFAPETRQEFLARGEQWIHWTRAFAATEPTDPLQRPRPNPPLTDRPHRLSVTQVEKLMRDPYAYYARALLKLVPLDAIDKEPGMAEFGTAVHKALEEFALRYPKQLPPDAESELRVIIEACFAELMHQVRAPSFWRRRLERIAQEVIAEEMLRRRQLHHVEAEQQMSANITVGQTEVTLKATIDRMDVRQDGAVDIIDFKTGTVPTSASVRQGLSPQLTLEGLLLQEAGLKLHELLYWKVPIGSKHHPTEKAGGDKSDPYVLIQEARAGLEQLLKHFLEEHTAYLSLADTPSAPSYNDYEHLERMEEWQ